MSNSLSPPTGKITISFDLQGVESCFASLNDELSKMMPIAYTSENINTVRAMAANLAAKMIQIKIILLDDDNKVL